MNRLLWCAMDLNYSKEELAFRDEVSGWLSDKLPADLRDKVARYAHLSRDDLLRWHKILAAKGWIAPSWPQEWGGTGWNIVQRYIFDEACGYAGAPPIIPFGLLMCAPVLLKFGTEAQKQRFLPRIYHGEDFWCQHPSPAWLRPASLSTARCGRATTWSTDRRRDHTRVTY
jgi:alkylation response protein AidB-like acyl-CoA dehydrogenase